MRRGVVSIRTDGTGLPARWYSDLIFRLASRVSSRSWVSAGRRVQVFWGTPTSRKQRLSGSKPVRLERLCSDGRRRIDKKWHKPPKRGQDRVEKTAQTPRNTDYKVGRKGDRPQRYCYASPSRGAYANSAIPQGQSARRFGCVRIRKQALRTIVLLSAAPSVASVGAVYWRSRLGGSLGVIVPVGAVAPGVAVEAVAGVSESRSRSAPPQKRIKRASVSLLRRGRQRH